MLPVPAGNSPGVDSVNMNQQDRIQRENVGAVVYLSSTAACLFRRHVARRTENTALTGHAQRILRRPHNHSDFVFRNSQTCPATFASPQSITSTSPQVPIMMFSGFNSR